MKGGIPQGSALGPLLFLIYMNTLPSRIGDALLLQYADDTTLVCSGPDPAVTASVMNQQLTLIHNWLVEHRMRLNVQKSCVMWFHIGRRKYIHTFQLMGSPYELLNSRNIWDLLLTLACHGIFRSLMFVKRCRIIYILLSHIAKFSNMML